MEDLKKNITVSVDGSENAMKSVDYISNMFDPEDNLEINIIYVMSSLPALFEDEKSIDKDILASVSIAEERHLARAKNILEKVKRRFIEKGFKEGKLKTIYRKQKAGIAQEVCHWARDKKTDALVVGRRGTTNLEDFFYGRVSNNVIEYCKDSPVWIIGGGLDSKKVLVCVDGSENATRAVDHAGFMLEGTDCEVTLFHTLRHLSRFVPADVLAEDSKLQEFWKQKAGENIAPHMKEAKDMLLKAGLNERQVSSKLLEGSQSPADDIIKEARTNGYGTVVLGKRGRSKFKQFLFGSVTRKILNNMTNLSTWVVQ